MRSHIHEWPVQALHARSYSSFVGLSPRSRNNVVTQANWRTCRCRSNNGYVDINAYVHVSIGGQSFIISAFRVIFDGGGPSAASILSDLWIVSDFRYFGRPSHFPFAFCDSFLELFFCPGFLSWVFNPSFPHFFPPGIGFPGRLCETVPLSSLSWDFVSPAHPILRSFYSIFFVLSCCACARSVQCTARAHARTHPPLSSRVSPLFVRVNLGRDTCD